MEERMLSSESIFDGKVFKVKRDQIELANGDRSMREIVLHNGGSCVVALTPENELLLVKQYRYAMGKELYEIPAGKLEPNEDAMECAARELTEETGYVAGRVEPLATIYSTPGYSSETIYVFRAYDLTFKAQHLDPGEFLDVIKVPVDKALEMIDDGEISDGKTQIGILKLARQLGK